MCRIAVACLIAGALLLAMPAGARSPWSPGKGRLESSMLTVYESYDEFYNATTRTELGPGVFQQSTTGMDFEYGLLDDLSVDLTLAYVRVFGDFGVNDGLNDSTLGVKWRVLDEFDWDQAWMPTVSLRLGGILPGTYEVVSPGVYPGVPGVRAGGIEAEVVLGKLLPWGFGLAGNLGVRARNHDVPTDWHLRIAGFNTIMNLVTLSLAYDQWRATSGVDLGMPPFDPNLARKLREHVYNIEAGLGVSDRGGRYYGAYYTRTVGGRNTGAKNIYGVAITLPFRMVGR